MTQTFVLGGSRTHDCRYYQSLNQQASRVTRRSVFCRNTSITTGPTFSITATLNMKHLMIMIKDSEVRSLSASSYTFSTS